MSDFFLGVVIGAIGAAVIFDWWWFGWTLSNGRCLHCGEDLRNTQGHFCGG
jgi:hypothetical protein